LGKQHPHPRWYDLVSISTLILGFGIKKLQITLVVEDDKVSLEELQEQLEEFEDYVQSTDIVYLFLKEANRF
jgi:translation elongation factor EF-1beta